jgi:plastocyanin
MEERIIRRTMEGFSLLVLAGAVVLGLALWTREGLAREEGPTTHTIFIRGVEIKGGTTADKLAPPAVNPKDLSKGYEHKAPGEADKAKPTRWEVSAYMFTPSFVTVRQGDTVKLTAFIVNGDEHEVWVTDPDGQKVVANQKWNRGREYSAEFVAKKAGNYQLMCSEHSPSMITTFLVLPR